MQPHRIAVADPERGEERGERVADESRVEVLQVPRAHHDQRGQTGGHECRPRARANALQGLTGADGQRPRPFDVGGPEDAFVRDAQGERRQRQEHEPWPDGAQLVAKHTEQQRWKESAEAAQRADETGDRARVLRKVLGHELEHRAVAQPQQHRAGRAPRP